MNLFSISDRNGLSVRSLFLSIAVFFLALSIAVGASYLTALGVEGEEGTHEEGTQGKVRNSRRTAITEAAQIVGPSVARVEVTKIVEGPSGGFFDDPFFRYFFGEPPEEKEREAKSLGSGFLIDWQDKKYVLTNQHVVDGAQEIYLEFSEGQQFKAKVIGSDALIDIAVLEITESLYGSDPDKLSPVQMGDSSSAIVGEWVVAIGNPEGFQNTVTAGVLSAKNRNIPKPDGRGQYSNLLQTDASINPGNSGGPLVNAEGKVIGINTAIIRRSSQGVPLTGLNFAVAIDSVKKVLPQLIKGGQVKRAWLGVWIQDLTGAMGEKFGVANNEGALVAEVQEGSPAEKAGIKSGDVIIGVNGEKVETSAALQEAIMYKEVGSTVDIRLVREGEEMVLQVTLGERPEETERAEGEQERITSDRYGMTLQENSPSLAEEMGLSVTSGLVVVDVKAGGRAAAVLQPGDVIVEAEGYPVDTVADWKEVQEQLGENEALLIKIARDRQILYRTL